MLNINVQEVDGVTILSLEGRLIFGEESNALGQRMRQLATEGKQQILVHLAEVSFIDSSGIGELIAGFTTIRKAGGTLKMSAPRQAVQDVFKIVRLPTVIEIFATQQQALASFA